MIAFTCDYNEGCHEKILEKLKETNYEQLPGYGNDVHTKKAKELICKEIGISDAQITFLAGGTQTNQVVIDAMCESYEGVVTSETGHVNCHEAGAIEFTGHKCLVIPSHDGKMDPKELEAYLAGFYADGNHEHMVFPGLVYVTYPTELGTLYTKKELEEIRDVAHKYDIPLYLDGARLAYGLASPACDLTIKDIAEITDVFYIGGTKCGALIGEAVVFTKQNEPKHFLTIVKEHGALLAKGRITALQFETLFTDGLYFEIGKHGMDMAEQVKEILKEKNYPFYLNSPTNQQFVIVENTKMEELKTKVGFDFWENYDADHTVIRFCTSWATKQESVDYLRTIL